ncbi:hypothetical protein [Flavivirga algicola]|uniref:3-keto-disaccharide hydrolase domain-containing protein n=1 Tax=Flavivirga algicola TaxID=2729136 RepID=A0ABX1S1X6_9FLAO|nr:hypothetical protein [Flavivirga algicola]NMH89831.1 hypothetical protein [Flavivirga algicola]
MIEQEYLTHCLKKIEEKLQWKPSHLWKESDFVKLSQIISEQSNISISPHTLKRLFGKIKYKTYYNPQLATKDALVKFLGYDDWQGFVSKIKSGKKIISPIEKDDKAKKNTFSRFNITAGAILLFILVGVVIQSQSNQNNLKISEDIFDVINSVGNVPFTVSAKYNLSNFKSDSLSIDFDFSHPIRGKQIVNIDKTRFIHNFTYQIPGYYSINLLDKEHILSSKKILAKSNGWDSYVAYEANRDNYWIDNQINKKDTTGCLYFSPKLLHTNGFDINTVFYVTNRLYKDFEIDGDHFELKTRFKNTKSLGGITCYDFILKLICEKKSNYLKLMESGCSQFSGVKMGDKIIEGAYENLSSFSFDTESWNTLQLIVKNKHVEITINDKLISRFNYTEPNGKIVGIENIFKGAGMLDFIRIRDLKTGKAFFDGF